MKLPTADTEDALRTNAESVQARIEAACRRSGRAANDIRFLWVGKNHPRETLLAAHAAGARMFGENRVQEVLEKFPLCAADGNPLNHELHFIGRLQRNKIRKLLPLCAAIHSVDSAELWEASDRIAGEVGVRSDVFLQVNTSREPNKSGFALDGFRDAVAALPPAPNLRLLGLMTIGPTAADPEAARPCFQALRTRLHDLQTQSVLATRFGAARFLSMGMSGDFEIAIEEGAHFLRLGTALFGGRVS